MNKELFQMGKRLQTRITNHKNLVRRVSKVSKNRNFLKLHVSMKELLKDYTEFFDMMNKELEPVKAKLNEIEMRLEFDKNDDFKKVSQNAHSPHAAHDFILNNPNLEKFYE